MLETVGSGLKIERGEKRYKRHNTRHRENDRKKMDSFGGDDHDIVCDRFAAISTVYQLHSGDQSA